MSSVLSSGNAGASASLLCWSRECLAFPDAPSQRIYDRARREQWSLETDIEPKALDLGQVPRSMRYAMAAIYTQIQYGEMLALTSAARFMETTPYGWARLFGATQIMDEARHVEFFARVVSSLDVESAQSPHLVEFGRALDASQSADELMIGTQVLLEGFAQGVLIEGAALGQRAQRIALSLPGSDGVEAFRRSVQQYIAKDEARHVAFGTLYLRARMADISAAMRDRLESLACTWYELLASALADMKGPLGRLGIDGDELRRRIFSSINTRLREIGMDLAFEPSAVGGSLP